MQNTVTLTMQWGIYLIFSESSSTAAFPKQSPTCLKTLDSKPKASSEIIRHTNGICSKEAKYIIGS